jgi:hypothetical protein
MKKIIRTNDLKPTGVRSTIKSDSHGEVNDFNETWKHIYSQMRNFNLLKEALSL